MSAHGTTAAAPRGMYGAGPTDEPLVIELDGPPMAYFEIPLDYYATPNGELEAPTHPEASRLIQTVLYMNFKVADQVRARNVVQAVTAKLKDLGGGYIWWRLRPTQTEDKRWWRLRLGTTPELPGGWWSKLGREVNNATLDHDPRSDY